MALYTKKLIMSTFQKMLEELPFDKITVSALVKRAGISPNTFYYHYRDIYALLDVWFREQMGCCAPRDKADDWRVATKTMLYRCREHSQMIYHVFNSLSRDRLERYIYSMTGDFFLRIVQQAAGPHIAENRLRDISAFCCNAYVGFILQFLWKNMESDIDESIERFGVLFDVFIANAIRAAE